MSNWIPVHIALKLPYEGIEDIVVHAVTIVHPLTGPPYVQSALVELPRHGAIELVIMPAERFFLTERPSQ